MFDRVNAILIKEFKQVFRDPRMKVVIFITPLIQIILFGYAANKDITYVPTAIFDRDNTKESRQLLRKFTYSKYFVPERYLFSEKEQDAVLDMGKESVVIRIDRDFGRDLKGKRGASFQLVYDGTDSNTAMVIMGYANTIVDNYQYELMRENADARGLVLPPQNRPAGKDPQGEASKGANKQSVDLARAAYMVDVPKVDLRDRAWFNGNLISRNYYLPGVVATIVTMMSLILSAMAIVKEKEIGTMEQLIVSPLAPIELILGKLLPFAVIAVIQVILITALGVIWFHIPLRGSVTLLLFSSCIYLITTLGIGLFISTISATQQEAMMSIFLFYMPTILLSGFAYPIANMPGIIQWFTLFNPLRYYLIIIRGIFLKGVGFECLWPHMLVLLVMGIIIITLSSLRFRKRLG